METAASSDSDSQGHAVEALQSFYFPGAMRASLAAVPLRTTSDTGASQLLLSEGATQERVQRSGRVMAPGDDITAPASTGRGSEASVSLVVRSERLRCADQALGVSRNAGEQQ
jgi:hypothetical protein